MSRALSSAVLVLALAASSAACGGSGGNSNGDTTTSKPSLTKQQFAAKVTQICANGKKKIAKIGFALGSMGSAANSGQAVADIEREMVAKFETLQPPDEIKSQADDFISKADTARAKLEQLVHAAKNLQAENVEQMTPEVASARREVHAAAKSLGATC